MLKKFFLIAAVAVCAVSCFDDGPMYKNQYLLYSTFEYGNVFESKDSLYFESTNGGGLGWMDMGFFHKLNKGNTEFYGGFILSRLKGSGSSEDDRFRVNSGVGNDKSSNYLVYYANPDKGLMPKDDIGFLSSEVGTCKILGCYVNNTKEVVNAVRNSFEVGDKLVLKMTGYLGTQKTAEQEIVLAEYTDQKDSVMTNWTAFKLEKLGTIETIDIEIVSTRDDIPKAFCLDDMAANIDLEY